MLQLLEVIDGCRVLEIGTATGHHAALLCHRLGAEHVASIELHPGLAADAAERLHGLGYDPTLGPTTHTQREAHESWWLRADDCWAEITTGATTTVTYGGPRNIWMTIERLATEWQRIGRPRRGRYGLTARTDGTHHYWLDHPDRLLLARDPSTTSTPTARAGSITARQ